MLFKTEVKKTVESVLAAFNQTIEDLEAIEKESLSDAASKETQADSLLNEAQGDREEANQARIVANNLRAIVGVKAAV